MLDVAIMSLPVVVAKLDTEAIPERIVLVVIELVAMELVATVLA